MGVGVQAKRDWPIQRAPRPGRWCAHRDLPSSFLGAPFPRSPISRSPSSKENRPPKREGEGEHVTTVFNLSWAARSIHPGERRGQERRKSALQRNRLVTSPVVKLVDSVVVGRRVTGLLRLYLLRRALVLTRRFRSPLSLSSNSFLSHQIPPALSSRSRTTSTPSPMAARRKAPRPQRRRTPCVVRR